MKKEAFELRHSLRRRPLVRWKQKHVDLMPNEEVARWCMKRNAIFVHNLNSYPMDGAVRHVEGHFSDRLVVF